MGLRKVSRKVPLGSGYKAGQGSSELGRQTPGEKEEEGGLEERMEAPANPVRVHCSQLLASRPHPVLHQPPVFRRPLTFIINNKEELTLMWVLVVLCLPTPSHAPAFLRRPGAAWPWQLGPGPFLHTHPSLLTTTTQSPPECGQWIPHLCFQPRRCPEFWTLHMDIRVPPNI